MPSITILGAGTWGTALAAMLGANDSKVDSVTLWSAIESEIETMRVSRRHPNFENMVLPDKVGFETDIEKACVSADIVIFAVPSPFIRETARKAAHFIKESCIIVDVAKGLEVHTRKTLSEVITDEIGTKNGGIVALSGPTHAEEVAIGLPTTIVAASENIKAAEYIQQMFSNKYFRVYTNSDIKGIEICGALKNIIALAAGISSGLGYGDNTKAAIITRGMAEITRLGVSLGCSERTFESLAGIGDLVVTCTSRHSRNNQAGFLIGKGMSAKEAEKEVGMVVEGINALPAAMEFAEAQGVELPICSIVDRIVKGELSASSALTELMSRDLKSET